jgi:hypothetical protein
MDFGSFRSVATMAPMWLFKKLSNKARSASCGEFGDSGSDYCNDRAREAEPSLGCERNELRAMMDEEIARRRRNRAASLAMVLSRRSSIALGPLTVDATRIRLREKIRNHVVSVRHYSNRDPSVRHYIRNRQARVYALKLRGRMSSHGEGEPKFPTIF